MTISNIVFGGMHFDICRNSEESFLPVIPHNTSILVNLPSGGLLAFQVVKYFIFLLT